MGMFFILLLSSRGTLVKNPPVNVADARDMGLIPGLVRSPEEEMATHSGILAWETPRTEEPGGLQSTGSQSHDWAPTAQHSYQMFSEYLRPNRHRAKAYKHALWITNHMTSTMLNLQRMKKYDRFSSQGFMANKL